MTRAIVLAVLAACSAPKLSGTTCAHDSDCNLFNVQGTCQTSGFCSYPDTTCAGGERYSPGAGSGLANSCVGGEPSCGGKDQACCAGGSCGANLACASDAQTCQCGGSGQPCCDATSCGAGLACSTAGACRAPLTFTQVAVGKAHICALASDQNVYCWGYDVTWNYDYSGHGTPVFGTDTPVKIGGLENVAEIRAAELHTCARESDGTLWCWGHDEHGQLGDGGMTSTASAVQVAGMTGVTLFDGGTFHTCALGRYNGTQGLWCWGRGGNHDAPTQTSPNPNLGRLGNGATSDSAVPVAVDLSAAAAAGQTVKALSTGKFHSCVVMSDDTVWCWGRDGQGELGNGGTTDTSKPVQVSFAGITIPAGVGIVGVTCSDGSRFGSGRGSTCMTLADGTSYCWGSNGEGELGDGTTTAHGTPTTPVATSVLGTAKLVKIASGDASRCGLASDGTVWCWGWNVKGLLGIGLDSSLSGSTQLVATPVQARGLAGVQQLDMSHHTACAIDGANHLLCWGNNQRGQITRRVPTSRAEAQALIPTPITF